MEDNTDVTYGKLREFLAFASNVMGTQADHINAGINHLLLQLTDTATPEQSRDLVDNIRRSRFLTREIISYWEVYDTMLELLYKPTQVVREQVAMHVVMDQAIEDAEMFLENSSNFLTVHMSAKDLTVTSIYTLLRHTLANMIIWLRLLIPSRPILIDITQKEDNIILNFSGYGPISDIIDEEACGLSMKLTEVLISILGGNFNWNSDKLIPDVDNLIVQFPK